MCSFVCRRPAIPQKQDWDVMRTFNLEAQKLAARGRTIIVSSGDNGVVEDGAYNTLSTTLPGQ